MAVYKNNSTLHTSTAYVGANKTIDFWCWPRSAPQQFKLAPFVYKPNAVSIKRGGFEPHASFQTPTIKELAVC